MTESALWLLLLIFLVHLGAFGVLGLRRRQVYYLALVVTFSLLSLAILTRLLLPDWQIGQWTAHELLRYAALISAVVSISWTFARVVFRLRQGSA